jgi:hypothetical protein
MNEHARATGSGVSSAVRSHIWLLAVLLAVITVRSLPVTGEEPPSSATRAREAITSPLSLLEPLPEEVPAPDPDEAHARVFLCNPFPSAAACGECHPSRCSPPQATSSPTRLRGTIAVPSGGVPRAVFERSLATGQVAGIKRSKMAGLK